MVRILLIIMMILLSSCATEWECDMGYSGRRAETKVDTFYHPDLDHNSLDHFVGGGVEVTISKHCIKGRKERFMVKGVKISGTSFSGWVDAIDLNLK